MKLKILVFSLLLLPGPAHAWMNSKGNPATGSAGLDNWTSTSRGGWGYDSFDRDQLDSYSRNGSINYQGRTYGIQVEGSFNKSGVSDDRLAISWGQVGSKTAKGFLAGAGGAAVASSDARMWALGGLGGGLIGAFIGYWEELEKNRMPSNNPVRNEPPVSHTNCPCDVNGPTEDTGSN